MIVSSARKGVAWLLLAAALLGVAAGGTAAPRAAAEEPSREYLIKAAFLYNFAKFTEWPADSFRDPHQSLTFCIIGEDPFGGALARIEGKEVGRRKIAIRQVASTESGAVCHLLFISASEAGRLREILVFLRDKPVLTVADMPDFAHAGGIIRLKTSEEEKVRFEINVATAERAGLRLSSKLLSLAEIARN